MVGALGGIVILVIGIRNIMTVIELRGRRTKIILDEGVRYYLQDLVSLMDDKLNVFTQKILLFAYSNPLRYAAFCIVFTILLAYLTDKIMHFILKRRYRD